jgi:hypothetical protein
MQNYLAFTPPELIDKCLSYIYLYNEYVLLIYKIAKINNEQDDRCLCRNECRIEYPMGKIGFKLFYENILLNNINIINSMIDSYINLERYFINGIDSECVNLLHKKELAISMCIYLRNNLTFDDKFINLRDLNIIATDTRVIYLTTIETPNILFVNPNKSPITRFRCNCFGLLVKIYSINWRQFPFQIIIV